MKIDGREVKPGDIMWDVVIKNNKFHIPEKLDDWKHERFEDYKCVICGGKCETLRMPCGLNHTEYRKICSNCKIIISEYYDD